MKAILDKQAIKLAYVAATDSDCRPILQCVRIGDGKIVASDGFMMAVRTIKTEPESGEHILLNASKLLQAKKILEKGDLLIESSPDNKAISISNETSTVLADNENGNYPNYDVIMPVTPYKAFVGIDATRLAKILKAADTTNQMTLCLKTKIREKMDPIVMQSGDTTMLLMPMTVQED